MTRNGGSSKYVYYYCGTHIRLNKNACTKHAIRGDQLENAVLCALRQQIYLAVSYTETIARINSAPLLKSQSVKLGEHIAAKEKELSKVLRYKQALYQDWKDGEITQRDYRHMSEDYERQAATLSAVLDRLNTEQNEAEKGVDTENPFLTAFRKHENIEKLTWEILAELIDHIEVYENGNIKVKFKFADEYRRVAEYIEANQHLQVG